MLILALRDAVAFRVLLADLEYADLVKGPPCACSKRLDDREGTDTDFVPCWAGASRCARVRRGDREILLGDAPSSRYTAVFSCFHDPFLHDVFGEARKVLT